MLNVLTKTSFWGTESAEIDFCEKVIGVREQA